MLLYVLMLTVVYGMIYSRMDPSSFGFKSPLDPYYFSFTTMSTVGYGDFSPKTDVSKLVVMSQQAIIFMELVSLFGKF